MSHGIQNTIWTIQGQINVENNIPFLAAPTHKSCIERVHKSSTAVLLLDLTLKKVDHAETVRLPWGGEDSLFISQGLRMGIRLLYPRAQGNVGGPTTRFASLNILNPVGLWWHPVSRPCTQGNIWPVGAQLMASYSQIGGTFILLQPRYGKCIFFFWLWK